MIRLSSSSPFFFFNDTATTEIYTLSLHDALPILNRAGDSALDLLRASTLLTRKKSAPTHCSGRSTLRSKRSEEHTSELQSRLHLVCRLLLEKKKKQP